MVLQDTWSQLRTHFQRNRDELAEALVGPAAEVAASYRSATPRLGDDPTEAVRLVLHRSMGWKDQSHRGHVVKFWFAHDPVLAFRHLAQASTLCLEWTEAHGFSVRTCLARQGLDTAAWFTLRTLAKTLAGRDAATVHDAVRTLYQDMPFPTRCALALALPKLELLSPEERRRGVFVLPNDLDFERRFYIWACLGASKHVDSTIDGYDMGASKFVAILGEDAVGPLRASLLGWSPRERIKSTMQALTPIDSLDCAHACARLLHEHHAMSHAMSQLRSRPTYAAIALSTYLADLREQSPAPTQTLGDTTELLHGVLRAHPDAGRTALATLQDAPAAVLRQALSDCQPLPEGPGIEALSDLPWNRAKASGAKRCASKKTSNKTGKRHQVPEASPALLPFDETIEWGPKGPPARPHRAGEYSDAKMTEWIRSRGYPSLMLASWMSRAGALEVLGEYDPQQWYAQPSDIESMLVLVGVDCLDTLVPITRRLGRCLAGLRHVNSPRIAQAMAHACINLKKHREVGKTWIGRFPEAAAIGLLPDLYGKGKIKKTAEQALRLLLADDLLVVQNAAKRYGDSCVARLKDLQAVDSTTLGTTTKRPRLPKFCRVDMLPVPVLRGGTQGLNAADTRELVTLLSIAKPGEKLKEFEDVRAACSPESLAAFVWSLFQQWRMTGAPMKTQWPFFALGHFGDAAAARTLGRLAKAWAPGGFPSRAQLAIEVLHAMDSDAALLEIYKTAERVCSRALAKKAKAVLSALAKSRGLSMLELTDRLVPDLGDDHSPIQ